MSRVARGAAARRRALRGAGGRQRLGGAARGPRRPLSGRAAGHGTDPRARPGAQPRRHPRPGADHSLPRFRLHRRPGVVAGDPRGLRGPGLRDPRRRGQDLRRGPGPPEPRGGLRPRLRHPPGVDDRPPRLRRHRQPRGAPRGVRGGRALRRPLDLRGHGMGHAGEGEGLPDPLPPGAVVRHPARRSMAELRRQWDRHVSHHWSMQPKTACAAARMGAARRRAWPPRRSPRSRASSPATGCRARASALPPSGRWRGHAPLPGAADARRARGSRPGGSAAPAGTAHEPVRRSARGTPAVRPAPCPL